MKEVENSSSGFTVIELLVVISIIGLLIALILFGIITARQKGADARVRNDIKQLRLLAEQTYDSNGASYLNWSSTPGLASDIALLRNDIDEAHGDAAGAPFQSTIVDTRDDGFCISADLVVGADAGDIICVDASGETKFVTSHCSDPAQPEDPLECPTS